MNKSARNHRGAGWAVLASIGCLAASNEASAQTPPAEPSPYYIGVTQGLSHDSNVYRVADHETADTIWTSGVIGGINLRLGRQRLFADADAEIHRYHRVTDLNNKSYSFRGGLDWETIDTLAGSLRYDTRNSLASFTTPGAATILSDQRTQQFTASARYGLASQVMLDASYDHRTLDVRSAGGRDFSQDTVSTGLRWAVGSKLTLGAAVRYTRGEQETVPVVDDTRRRDIDLTATWATGGFSTFNARLSATKETHSLASNADLSETTGSLSWSYRPTAKLTFNATATRDTGTETTFTAAAGGSGTEGLQADNARLSTTFAVDTQYELTGKISLNGYVRQRKGTLTTSQSEAVKAYGLGLAYLPSRSLALRCSVSREDRTVGGANAYQYTLTGCTGEVTFR